MSRQCLLIYYAFRFDAYGKTEPRETGVELGLELVSKSAEIEYRENPTF